MRSDEFESKTVFITGAASGIGQAQARAFLNSGAAVYGFDVNEEGLAGLKAEYPCSFAYFAGSVTDRQAVAMAAEQARDVYGNIHILANTAGLLDGYAKTLETDEALWNRIMDTNVKGMYYVTNEVLPQMLAENRGGAIINMASVAGLVAGGGGAAYTASKHAVIGYTKQLSLDYSREGIRANAIAPGAIETPMNAADFAGDGSVAKWVAKETPAGRWAKPEEVAQLTLFLASSASNYITGAVIPIDGGWIVK